ncbi:MAG: AsmA family protein [Gammaproteobacteria bacterium]|nr:AsmA family protein [Gammaproteobacteria bacterium]
MASLIKWLLGLVLVVVLLAVAAVVILPMVIDPNDYKPQIVAKAKETLGRDLVIERDLSLSVFPWLGIETGGVRIGNAPGFEADAFAEIEQLGLKVKLVPLLSRRVEVDTLVLTGLRVNLEKDASGKTNWDDLAAADDSAASKADSAPADDGGAPVSLSVQGIQIEDANISWDDRQAGQTYLLEGVRLVTGALAPGATVPVEGGVTFTSNKPAMTLKAALDATVSSDADLAVFEVADLVLELDAAGEGLPSGGAQLRLKTDLVADTRADTLRLDNLEVSGPAMAAKGRVAVASMQSNPTAEGKLSIAETNLKTLASMFASPIETTDPAALTRAGGDIGFSYADGALKLDPLKLKLDDSSLDGHVHVLDPTGPVVRTRLTLDQIDLDRYMPPPGDAGDAGDSGAAATGDSGDASAPPAGDPFAALRPLDFVGEFTIGSLKVNNARLRDVSTKIVSKKGVLTVDPMAAKLYEGTFNGRVVVNASGKTPKVAAKKSFNNIQVGQLLADVAGQDRLLGRGELHVDITAVGLSEAEVRRSLNGTSRFAFKDGAVKGVNIAQVIREGSSRLGLGGDALATGTPGQTDFSELTGSLTMTNGVIKNQDLTAKSPLLRVEGKGEVDLPRDTIDYLVVTELVGTLEGQGGKSGSELSGVPIPVRVTGPLTDPSYRPDLEAALSAKAKAQLDAKKAEVKQKVQEKVEEKLKGNVGEALKGLFN